jgi:hypothetical protein
MKENAPADIPWSAQREDDPHEDAHLAAAVYARGVLDVGREAVEIAFQ